jgi:hypothetical protein
MTVEGERGVGEYIFLHHHSEQNQDQTQLVSLEAIEHNSINKHISTRNHFQTNKVKIHSNVVCLFVFTSINRRI